MENSADAQSITTGKGFTMKDDLHPSSSINRPSVEFRQGDSSEEAINRLEKERKEQERLHLEELEKEASMTLADKAKRDEEWAREDRKFMADWFEDGIKRGGESSETLIIKPDGTLDHKKRLDEGFGTVPFIASAGKLEKPEDLYKLMAKISEEHPQLSISVESDPNMQWIKYKVLKKK